MTPVLSVAMDLPLEWVRRQTLTPCNSPEELSRLYLEVESPRWISRDQRGHLTLKTGAHPQIADLELTLTDQRRQLSAVAVRLGLLPCCGSPAKERAILLQMGAGDGDTTLQLAQWWRPFYPLLYLVLGEPPRRVTTNFLPTDLIRWKDYASTFGRPAEERGFVIRPNARDGTLDIALGGVLPSPSQALELAALAQTLTAFLLAEGPGSVGESSIDVSKEASHMPVTLVRLIDQLDMQSIALGTQSYLDAIRLRLTQSEESRSLNRRPVQVELAQSCLAWGEH